MCSNLWVGKKELFYDFSRACDLIQWFLNYCIFQGFKGLYEPQVWFLQLQIFAFLWQRRAILILYSTLLFACISTFLILIFVATHIFMRPSHGEWSLFRVPNNKYFSEGKQIVAFGLSSEVFFLGSLTVSWNYY